MSSRRILSLAVCASLTLAVLAKYVAAAEPVRIAIVGPMTGDLSVAAEQLQRGVAAAIRQVPNRELLGRPIDLEVFDDFCDTEVATAIARKLVAEKAAVVFGHVCSEQVSAVQQIYAAGNVLEITSSATNPILTERGLRTFFRMAGRDDNQSRYVAERIIKQWPGRKVAILSDGALYGESLGDGVADQLERSGVNEVFKYAYRPQAQDYSNVIAQMKQAGVEVVYLGGYHVDAGIIVRQAREANMTAQFVGSATLASPDFATAAGSASDGLILTSQPDLRDIPLARPIVEQFRKDGFEPEGFTLSGYAAFQAWEEGVGRAHSADAFAVADAIRSAPIDTVIGPVRFDEKGELHTESPDFVWYRWLDGKLAYAP